jgi:hypothetical protein
MPGARIITPSSTACPPTAIGFVVSNFGFTGSCIGSDSALQTRHYPQSGANPFGSGSNCGVAPFALEFLKQDSQNRNHIPFTALLVAHLTFLYIGFVYMS